MGSRVPWGWLSLAQVIWIPAAVATAQGPAEAGIRIVGQAPEGFVEEATSILRQIEAWRGAKFPKDVVVEFVPPPDPPGTQAGWYEPKTRRLVVVRKGTERFQRGTLLHELCHALQDQRFDLSRLHEEAAGDPDRELALSAAIEGEAMLAVADLLAYDFRKHATLAPEGPLDGERFRKIFLYGTGQDFIRAVRDRGGWAEVDRVFRTPPRTTSEIYAPDIWPTPDSAAPPRPATMTLPASWRGAYGLHLLLAQLPSNRGSARLLAAALRRDAPQAPGEGAGDPVSPGGWSLDFVSESAAARCENALQGAPGVERSVVSGLRVLVVPMKPAPEGR